MLHYREKLAPLFRFKTSLLAVGVVFFAPAFFVPRESFWMHTFGFTVESFGSALLVLWAFAQSRSESNPGPLARLPIRVIAYVGLYSYSIYVWHEPYGQAVIKRLIQASSGETPYGFALGAFIIASVVLGVVSYRLIETPSLRLRDRLFPTRFKGPESTSNTEPPVAAGVN